VSKPSATVSDDEITPRLRVEMLLNKVAALVNDGVVPARPFQPPALPPGVGPSRGRSCLAMDNAMAGYSYLQGEWCGLGFPGYPYLSNLAQRSEYRAPTETIASEMTREWIKFTGADEKEQKELEDAYKKFGIRDCIRMVDSHDGFFGRGQLFVNIKNQDGPRRRMQPLIVDDNGATIRKGDLLGFKPVEPMWTTPYAYNSNDPTAADFYKPDIWYILGNPTHSTRLLTFISRPVPDILKPSYNFSGLSLSQLIEPYVIRWLKTVDSVNRLISNFSTSGILTDLQSSLQGTAGDGTDIFTRMNLFTKLRDNRGLMVLNKGTEEFFKQDTSLAGLSELQAQAQEHMAAPTHIPLVKLTGITPSGLNASSEGEIKVFYDFIKGEQMNTLGAHMDTILRIVQLHLWGKVNPDIDYEWVPLDTPTDKELAEMRKSDGDRDVSYIGAGVVAPEETRTKLKNDPNSGYNFIEGEAPEPPEAGLMDKEHQLGEKGKEADAERGEESAEAAAKREKDAREHQAKLDKGAKKKAD
jgi:phage-related protein (TIGR01555 family)